MARDVNIGEIFGRLTVVDKTRGYVKCLCVCGNTAVVKRCRLTSGNTKSCGCLKKEVLVRVKHGRANSRVTGYNDRTYGIWQAMRQRCSNPNHSHYGAYGGRGIRVCQDWDESFDKFVEDMGNAPEGMSIDRIDTDKGYNKNNCTWATSAEQGLNTQKSKVYEVNGVRKTINGWSREWGLWWKATQKKLETMLNEGQAIHITKERLIKERLTLKEAG